MGPFKHPVDDGLDGRKAAFECMYTLLETCLDRLDVYVFLEHVEKGEMIFSSLCICFDLIFSSLCIYFDLIFSSLCIYFDLIFSSLCIYFNLMFSSLCIYFDFYNHQSNLGNLFNLRKKNIAWKSQGILFHQFGGHHGSVQETGSLPVKKIMQSSERLMLFCIMGPN